MFITAYSYEDDEVGGWNFTPMVFKRVNLLVGASGAGKSRFLNTLHNLAVFIKNNEGFRSGKWSIEFRTNGHQYKWRYHGDSKTLQIIEESLDCLHDGQWQTIFHRKEGRIQFGGLTLPKLPNNSTCLYLLKEEDQIAPVYEGFGRIIRRNFFGPELQTACAITNIPQNLEKLEHKKNLRDTIEFNLSLNVRMALLKEKAGEKYKEIISIYKSIFQTIENIEIADGSSYLESGNLPLGRVPVLIFKEKYVDQPIFLHELSSGMQKVLLIIVDIVLAKEDSIVLIDEYENSLGVNAIDFLPDFLVDYGEKQQFFITSHHPYLINNMPIDTWQVFHRKGSKVTVDSGKILEDRYGKSAQGAFIKLINDPFYLGLDE